MIPFPVVSPASEIAWSSPSWTLWREGGRERGRGKGKKGMSEERKEGMKRRNSFTIPFLSPSSHTYHCFSVDRKPTVSMPPHSQLPRKLKRKTAPCFFLYSLSTRVYHATMTSLPLYCTSSRRGLQTLQFLTLGSSLHSGGSHQLGCAGSNVMGGDD